ncbi:hypothetical protein BMJ34_24580 [Sinorhizobium medicae]|uniref:Uncharacterized protein n=1 Tax=Sinorhizobium medicae TaxID=110321 RepID=A0ABX4TBR6_9HYPH|nr:hypothetical protein BMJ35_20570 [Sinorhizobium medicae]PLT90223.1 hypothetical protein BMJ33_36550 [Sinorhizobium medicae]PLT92285.1 hypothetical protein BMJ34_24580 [Sinorhizobium medicae]PLU15588.1 hypothetical protein BMJ29_25815 [Sinorhizobium medicae]PLU19938.1 hypothetical protein BMJ30_09590 [Sinorhizobium medicae]
MFGGFGPSLSCPPDTRVFFRQIAWITPRMPVMVAPEGIRLAMCIAAVIRKSLRNDNLLVSLMAFGAGSKGQKS